MPDTPSSRPVLIFDTTVLSNFATAGQLALLKRLYSGDACTTLMVMEEILRGLDAGYEYLQSVREALSPLSDAGWLPMLTDQTPQEQALHSELPLALGPGEASCLVMAITRGLILATDDLAVRRAASERGVRLTGTLGILIRLVREGYLALPDANTILARMISLRYRSPVERLDELI
jgi:predicted nucleic acid-binding protein